MRLLIYAALGAMGACAGEAVWAAETCAQCLDAGVSTDPVLGPGRKSDISSTKIADSAPGRRVAARPSPRSLVEPPLIALGEEMRGPAEPVREAPPPSAAPIASLVTGPVPSVHGLGDPTAFRDVMAIELDVARIAGSMGFSVDRSDARLMGRVALRIVNDQRWGEQPTVTDVYDPYVRALAQSRPTAPVDVYDLDAAPRRVLPRRGIRLDYANSGVTGDLPGSLELALEPRANLVFGEVNGVGGGAVVRFGQNLTSPRKEAARWYAFLGADAQALTWSLDRSSQDHSLKLEDKQLVGDYQAGVAVKVEDGDLAFGFVHREVSWSGVSRDEDYLGVSYTLSR